VAGAGGPDRESRGATGTEKGRIAKPIVVERLTHLDVNDICSMYKRVWDGFKGDLAAELVKSWQPTPLEFTSWMEGVTYFAARRDGKLIGAIGCEINDGSCRLVNLAVDHDSRRQGIATALTQAAIEWARHNASHSIWVDALARFTEATGVFTSTGFVECGILHRHYWNEDVRLFELLL
jgi:GNAT superfamily N-acetyltransferase